MDYIQEIDLLNESNQLDMCIYLCDAFNIQAMQENAVSETIRKGWEAIIKTIKTAWEWFKEKVLMAYNFIKKKLTRNKNTINKVKENLKEANYASNGRNNTNSNFFNKNITRKRLNYDKRGRFLSLMMKCDNSIKAVEPYLINPLLNKFDKKMTRDQLYDYFTLVARSTSLLAKKGGINVNKDIIEEDIFEDVILLKDGSLNNKDQFFEEEKFNNNIDIADIVKNIEKENKDFESLLNNLNQDYKNINNFYKKMDKIANDNLKIKNPDESQKYYQKAVTTCVKVIVEITKMINAVILSLNTALDYNNKFLEEVNDSLVSTFGYDKCDSIFKYGDFEFDDFKL